MISCREPRRDSGAAPSTPSVTASCAGTRRPSDSATGSPSWIGKSQEELIESVVARLGFRSNDKRFPKGEVLAELFSLGCNTGETLRTLLARRYRYFIDLEEKIAQVAVAYEERKKEVNSLDFDDLLSKTHELLLSNPEIAASYQRRFRAILVDEYQDTNRLQAGLIDTLAATHRHIMVVGDDAQSIYSWRGADFANIPGIPEALP